MGKDVLRSAVDRVAPGDSDGAAVATKEPATVVDASTDGGSGKTRSLMIGAAVIAVLVLATQTDLVIESLLLGATENSPLVLAALGFGLLYKLTGLLNVAFAETITLGAYFAVSVSNGLGIGFTAAVIPAGLMAGLLSVATYLVVFRPAINRRVSGLELIVMSFGLSLFLRHALQFVFGYTAVGFESTRSTSVDILGVGVTTFRLFAVGCVAVFSLVIYQFIRRTSYGLQIRALASNSGLAQASGVRPLPVTLLIWFVAGFAGGLAGAFYAVASSAQPLLGSRQLLLILLIVLVGGIWDLFGIVWVGVATSVVLMGLKLSFDSDGDLYSEMVLVVVFLAVLKFRGARQSEGSKV